MKVKEQRHDSPMATSIYSFTARLEYIKVSPRLSSNPQELL